MWVGPGGAFLYNLYYITMPHECLIIVALIVIMLMRAKIERTIIIIMIIMIIAILTIIIMAMKLLPTYLKDIGNLWPFSLYIGLINCACMQPILEFTFHSSVFPDILLILISG